MGHFRMYIVIHLFTFLSINKITSQRTQNCDLGVEFTSSKSSVEGRSCLAFFIDISKQTAFSSTGCSGVLQVVIPKDNRLDIDYSTYFSKIASTSLDNIDWSFYEENGNYIWTYNHDLIQFERSIIGFNGLIHPRLENGKINLVAEIMIQNATDANHANNESQIQITYFKGPKNDVCESTESIIKDNVEEVEVNNSNFSQSQGNNEYLDCFVSPSEFPDCTQLFTGSEPSNRYYLITGSQTISVCFDPQSVEDQIFLYKNGSTSAFAQSGCIGNNSGSGSEHKKWSHEFSASNGDVIRASVNADCQNRGSTAYGLVFCGSNVETCKQVTVSAITPTNPTLSCNGSVTLSVDVFPGNDRTITWLKKGASESTYNPISGEDSESITINSGDINESTQYYVYVRSDCFSSIDDVTSPISVNVQTCGTPASVTNPSSDISACEGVAFTVTKNVSGTPPIRAELHIGSRIYTDNNVTTTAQWTIPSNDINSGTHPYFFEVFNDARPGGQQSTSKNVIVESEPNDRISKSGSLCTELILSSDCSNCDSWLWDEGQGTRTIAVNQSGTYRVTVTKNGCPSEGSITIQSEDCCTNPPNATISTQNSTICASSNEQTTLAVQASCSGCYYKWSNGAEGPSSSIAVNVPGTYSVTVTDANDCNDVDSIVIESESDSDGDGVCNSNDECPNFDDGLIGELCNDGDPCTTGERYNSNCNCTGGTLHDDDNDGVCNTDDQCPGYDDGLIGTICDDNNSCTDNDRIKVTTSGCECIGIHSGDSDGDGVCNNNDQCSGFDDGLIGTACNDNVDCTINDVYTANCGCEGEFFDTNDNGICDLDEACTPGNACSDGDVCTVGDTYNANCECISGPENDSDGDGVCDGSDICNGTNDNDIGMPCNDNDPCTINDVYTTDCDCKGIFQDSDDDGVCDADECGNIGTPCNDGSACTINDAIQANCQCEGTFEDDDGDGICNNNDSCPNLHNSLIGLSCSDGDACTVNDRYTIESCGCAGTFQDSDEDGTCDADENDNEGCTPGSPCNDNSSCTENDAFDANCQCVGVYGDSDNDGTCDALDLCPNFDNTLIGTPCNDNNPNTENDVYTSNCTCQGQEVDGCQVGQPCDDENDCTTGETFNEDCLCTGGVENNCPCQEAEVSLVADPCGPISIVFHEEMCAGIGQIKWFFTEDQGPIGGPLIGGSPTDGPLTGGPLPGGPLTGGSPTGGNATPDISNQIGSNELSFSPQAEGFYRAFISFLDGTRKFTNQVQVTELVDFIPPYSILPFNGDCDHKPYVNIKFNEYLDNERFDVIIPGVGIFDLRMAGGETSYDIPLPEGEGSYTVTVRGLEFNCYGNEQQIFVEDIDCSSCVQGLSTQANGQALRCDDDALLCELFSHLEFEMIDLYTINVSFSTSLEPWMTSNLITLIDLNESLSNYEKVQLNLEPFSDDESQHIYGTQVEYHDIFLFDIGLMPQFWSQRIVTEYPNIVERDLILNMYGLSGFQSLEPNNSCQDISPPINTSFKDNSTSCSDSNYNVNECGFNVFVEISSEGEDQLLHVIVITNDSGERIIDEQLFGNVNKSYTIEEEGQFTVNISTHDSEGVECQFSSTNISIQQVGPSGIVNNAQGEISLAELLSFISCEDALLNNSDCTVIKYFIDGELQIINIDLNSDPIPLPPVNATSIQLVGTNNGSIVHSTTIFDYSDSDGDGEPNISDQDADNDGTPNNEQTDDNDDLDGDGIDNGSDPDIDNDGILNEEDDTPYGAVPEICDNCIDDDGDGYTDVEDIDCYQYFYQGQGLVNQQQKSTECIPIPSCPFEQPYYLEQITELALNEGDPDNPGLRQIYNLYDEAFKKWAVCFATGFESYNGEGIIPECGWSVLNPQREDDRAAIATAGIIDGMYKEAAELWDILTEEGGVLKFSEFMCRASVAWMDANPIIPFDCDNQDDACLEEQIQQLEEELCFAECNELPLIHAELAYQKCIDEGCDLKDQIDDVYDNIVVVLSSEDSRKALFDQVYNALAAWYDKPLDTPEQIYLRGRELSFFGELIFFGGSTSGSSNNLARLTALLDILKDLTTKASRLFTRLADDVKSGLIRFGDDFTAQVDGDIITIFKNCNINLTDGSTHKSTSNCLKIFEKVELNEIKVTDRSAITENVDPKWYYQDKDLVSINNVDSSFPNLGRAEASSKVDFSEIDDPELMGLVDEISMGLDALKDEGDILGEVAKGGGTEKLTDIVFKQNGYTKEPSSFGSNNGFDGVYIKKSENGEIEDIIIAEAKQMKDDGQVFLTKAKPPVPTQMTNEWILNVLERMQHETRPDDIKALGELIQDNIDKVNKVVTAVGRTTNNAASSRNKLHIYNLGKV